MWGSAQELEDAGERDRFQSTIPAQLGVIWGTLQAGDEAAAQEALELFIEVAEAHPRFLRRSLSDIAGAMLQARPARSPPPRCAPNPFSGVACGLHDDCPACCRWRLGPTRSLLVQCPRAFLSTTFNMEGWRRVLCLAFRAQAVQRAGKACPGWSLS